MDRVGDVGPGEREVLKGASEAPVGCHVVDQTVVRELLMSVDKREARLAIGHSRMSRAYWRWWRKRPWVRSTVIPRKWWRRPGSFIANSR
jgi:hypothetical protein